MHIFVYPNVCVRERLGEWLSGSISTLFIFYELLLFFFAAACCRVLLFSHFISRLLSPASSVESKSELILLFSQERERAASTIAC